MSTYKRPLKRSLLAGIIVFVFILCLALCATQYYRYRSMMYSRYEQYITNILHYAAAGIDADDLAECIRTGEESKKFQELQVRLDDIKENMDLHFIYAVIPLNTDETDNIMNVIAGVSEEERINNADELVYLGMLTGDSYSPATAKKYLDAYETGELSFFEEVSQWGDDYTGLLPIYDSAGNKVCALCVDVDVAFIHSELYKNVASLIAVVLILGIAFAISFVFWADRNIISPIRRLESSVVKFAWSNRSDRDPNALTVDLPNIKTDNEVESLSRAILKMSEDMRDYVRSVVFAENELARMEILANKDALTNVRNKNAFDHYTKELQLRIDNGDQLQFAVLMVDINYLKRINDTYGHEKGDRYLKNSCKLICEIFAHSPVFRIGGDEFTVVLTDRDYADRDALIARAKSEIGAAETDVGLRPWERVSAAIGYAIYTPGRDATVEAVLLRADQDMYREKLEMKAKR